MLEGFEIRAASGPYTVKFVSSAREALASANDGRAYHVVDATVARLYAEPLREVLHDPSTLIIEATEENKSIQQIIPVIERLVEGGMRRGHTLVAIGGGIIQDVTCFIASVFLRGVMWRFVPTTLLAQADSCIGSKSSINLGRIKNVLGTFNPPREISVCPSFLDTLHPKDICSGVGEIIKVHAIEGGEAFDRLAQDYERLFAERAVLLEYVRAALLIKRRFIEVDEFDRGIRNIFNYGHSFGHALESATGYAVPHGVAVAMGMDIANRVAVLRGILPEAQFRRMHGILRQTYGDFVPLEIALDAMLSALTKDKKNTASALVLILPTGPAAKIERVEVVADGAFRRELGVALKEAVG